MLMSLETRRKIIRYTSILGIILTIIGSIYIGRAPYFQPGGGFTQSLERMGYFSPLVFVFVQISQTIYPIIPAGLTNVIGDVIYGHRYGFVYNLIGMLIGSAINFHLGRKYGGTLIRAFISDQQYEHYLNIMHRGDGFKRLLIVGFIAPLFPDDIFCMIAGLSKMTFSEFYKLVVLYRPVSLFVFTYIASNLIQRLFEWFF